MTILRRPVVAGLLTGLAFAGSALTQSMGESWGQPFIVDNKPGASEIIAPAPSWTDRRA